LMCMSKLFELSLQRNKLSGSFPQIVLNGMTKIYRLNLDSNQLTGQLPLFDEHTPDLRYLYLRDNKFSGSVQAQLMGFTKEMVGTSGSGLFLDGNYFTGVLPKDVFYKLLTDAHSVQTFSATRNLMLCDPLTGEWPAWVFRLGTANFGKCTPLAKVSSVSGDLALGQRLEILGSDFIANPELKCKVGNTTFAAAAPSSTKVLCGPLVLSPEEIVPGGSYEVSVANYGDDFWGPTTALSTYSQVMAKLPFSPPPPSPPSPPSPPLQALLDMEAKISSLSGDEVGTGGIAGIVVAVVISIVFAVVLVVMIKRERSGKPVFRPIVDSSTTEGIDNRKGMTNTKAPDVTVEMEESPSASDERRASDVGATTVPAVEMEAKA